jgi:hypothetical protein
MRFARHADPHLFDQIDIGLWDVGVLSYHSMIGDDGAGGGPQHPDRREVCGAQRPARQPCDERGGSAALQKRSA